MLQHAVIADEQPRAAARTPAPTATPTAADRARAGYAPIAQQDAERRPEQPGGGEQQVAADAVAADGGDRLGAEHQQAGDDGRAAEDALAGVGRSRSTTVARIRPNSAAQAGWMVVPWPSGTSMKPV